MVRKPQITVSIVFDLTQAPRPELEPLILYYGEALWDEFREEPRVSISFDDIDKVRDRLSFTATSLTVAKRAAFIAERLLSKSNLVGQVTISAMDVA